MRQDIHTQLSFRPAQDSDIDFLYDLHVVTMREYVDQTWGWDDAVQETMFRKHYIPAEIQIITLNDKDIGMISLEERKEDVFLRVIEIHPAYQRQNLGTTIIQKIINDAIHKMKPIHLRVLRVNPAKRLYERLGFSVIEETKTHYIMRTSTL